MYTCPPHIVSTAIFQVNLGWLAGCPLDFPNKGFWCKVLWAWCPSLYQTAETLDFTFSASTVTAEREGRGGTLFCVSCLMPGPQLNADGIVFRHDEQFVSQLNTMTHAGSSALFIDNAAACVLCRRMHQCCLVHWWWSDREFLSICRTVKFGWDPLSVLARHYKLSFLSHLSHFENLPLDWHLHLILSMLSVMWMWTFVAELLQYALTIC